jgi:hypothetical protein
MIGASQDHVAALTVDLEIVDNKKPLQGAVSEV